MMLSGIFQRLFGDRPAVRSSRSCSKKHLQTAVIEISRETVVRMDSEDDENDVYDDAISTVPETPQNNDQTSKQGEGTECSNNTDSLILLDTDESNSAVYDLATFPPPSDHKSHDSGLNTTQLTDVLETNAEQSNNDMVLLGDVTGDGKHDATEFEQALDLESKPNPCDGVPLEKDENTKDDVFVYDMAKPFPGKTIEDVKLKSQESGRKPNDPLPIPKELSSKGDNMEGFMEDNLNTFIRENVYLPMDSVKKPHENRLEASGVYEPIMPPDGEKYKTAKMFSSQLSEDQNVNLATNKWDTLRRGAGYSMRIPDDWPPSKDYDVSSSGTMYTDIYYPEDDSDEKTYLELEPAPDYNSDSEFEDDEFETVSTITDDADQDYLQNNKPLPPKPSKSIFKQLRPSFRKANKLKEKHNKILQSFEVNTKKHPPPELPPAPDNLTNQQSKKRHVIQSIIDSEKSYLDSLDRIVRIYQTPLLSTFGLERTIVKDVFSLTEEILTHHKMFQIELTDCVKNWDRDEKIGNIFTASFSRAMLVDVYSAYVNKFSEAMEEIKTAQGLKANLRDFLKRQTGSETPRNPSSGVQVASKMEIVIVNQEMSPDRLSIFGLMVKPVQRFPQFIMFMQDLLKYTPSNHHDRCALQGALTDLENVAHCLNESKRESEQYLEAKRLMKKLPKTFTHRSEKLLRQDDFEQLDTSNGEIKTKKRRLFLMDDCLICVTVLARGTSPHNMVERYRPKSNWMPPPNLVDLELKDSAISPEMHSIITGNSRKMLIQTKVPINIDEDPLNLYRDLNEMMHDLTVLGKVAAFVSSLKRSYEGLTEELVHETVRDLQTMIQVKDQQLQLLNSCTITLHDNAKNIRYTFQTARPEMKQEWCKDFLMAKFALEPVNRPGWMKCEDEADSQPAVFMKAFSVDMPRNFTKMKCAIPVFLTSSGRDNIGIQHLWVVMTTERKAQVALVSTQSTKPALVESFQAAQEDIVAVETVEGFAETEHLNAFAEDTVWMSTANSEIIVYSLYSESGRRSASSNVRKPRSRFYCQGIAMVMRSIDYRVFAGLNNGNLVIFDRDRDGVWNLRDPKVVVIDSVPIRCITSIEEEIWLSCRDTVYIIPEEENDCREKIKMGCGQDDSEILEMVKSGVGLWVAYKNSSKICLFHLETKELLQEFNVKSAVERMISSCQSCSLAGGTDSCSVTALTTSRGFLWIGTSLGFILTVSLPRLRDGLPRIWDKPWVSCHAHQGPVKFLIPIYCDTVNLWQMADLGQMAGIPTAMDNSNNSGASEKQEKLDMPSVKVLPQSKTDSLELPKYASTLTGAEAQAVQDMLTIEPSATSASEHQSSPDVVYSNDDKSKVLFQKELNEKLALGRPSHVRGSPLRTSVHTILDSASPKDEVELYYSDLLVCDEGSDSSQNLEPGQNGNHFKPVSQTNEPSETVPLKPALKRSVSEQSATEKPKRGHKSVLISSGAGSKAQRRQSSLSLRMPMGPRVSALDTLKKRNCNAVMLISGGDGYVNWNVEQKQSRNDESSLMMWMYKF